MKINEDSEVMKSFRNSGDGKRNTVNIRNASGGCILVNLDIH